MFAVTHYCGRPVFKIVLVSLLLVAFGQCMPSSIYEKRTAVGDQHEAAEYSEYQQISSQQYDEYPMVVPKRSYSFLDRIILAMQNVLESEKSIGNTNNLHSSTHQELQPSNLDLNTRSSLRLNKPVDLQRRGNGNTGGQQHKGGNYWRCYFNAVTCF